MFSSWKARGCCLKRHRGLGSLRAWLPHAREHMQLHNPAGRGRAVGQTPSLLLRGTRPQLHPRMPGSHQRPPLRGLRFQTHRMGVCKHAFKEGKGSGSSGSTKPQAHGCGLVQLSGGWAGLRPPQVPVPRLGACPVLQVGRVRLRVVGQGRRGALLPLLAAQPPPVDVSTGLHLPAGEKGCFAQVSLQ